MKKKFIIPYQYTISAYATVHAESLEEAVALVEANATCPEPEDHDNGSGVISETNFGFLGESFRIVKAELDQRMYE